MLLKWLFWVILKALGACMKKQDVYLGARQSNGWSPLWNAMFLPCQWSICLIFLAKNVKWMLLWSLAINTHAVQPLNSGVFHVKVPTAHLHTHKGLGLAHSGQDLKCTQIQTGKWTAVNITHKQLFWFHFLVCVDDVLAITWVRLQEIDGHVVFRTTKTNNYKS